MNRPFAGFSKGSMGFVLLGLFDFGLFARAGENRSCNCWNQLKFLPCTVPGYSVALCNVREGHCY